MVKRFKRKSVRHCEESATADDMAIYCNYKSKFGLPRFFYKSAAADRNDDIFRIAPIIPKNKKSKIKKGTKIFVPYTLFLIPDLIHFIPKTLIFFGGLKIATAKIYSNFSLAMTIFLFFYSLNLLISLLFPNAKSFKTN